MGDPEDMGDPEQGGAARRRARRPTTARSSSAGDGPSSPGPAAVLPLPGNSADASQRSTGMSGEAGGAPTEETPFDIWLSRSLHQMFDRVKDEAIPPELLRLIEEDRDRRRG
jgi:hypothetical protein